MTTLTLMDAIVVFGSNLAAIITTLMLARWHYRDVLAPSGDEGSALVESLELVECPGCGTEVHGCNYCPDCGTAMEAEDDG